MPGLHDESHLVVHRRRHRFVVRRNRRRRRRGHRQNRVLLSVALENRLSLSNLRRSVFRKRAAMRLQKEKGRSTMETLGLTMEAHMYEWLDVLAFA